MRLDSSGNLGIGTASPSRRLHVVAADGVTNSLFSGATYALRTQSIVGVGTVLDAVAANESTYQPLVAGGSIFAFQTGGTERMRLDASGNLGLGVTPTNNTFGKSLQNGQASAWVSETGSNRFWLGSNWYHDGADKYIGTGHATLYSQQTGQHLWLISASGSAGGTISFTQAMTLDASGNLLIGTTSSGGAGGASILPLGGGAGSCAIQVFNKSNTASDSAILFRVAGSNVSGISYTNTTVTYGTSSDRRLKDNIAPADNAGSVIDAIEVVKHDWKAGGHTRYGMIAQDLHMVAPEAVLVGDADDVEDFKNPWGVDYSKLVPMMMKELQSLRKRVAELESK
jgi:hypothetical protein